MMKRPTAKRQLMILISLLIMTALCVSLGGCNSSVEETVAPPFLAESGSQYRFRTAERYFEVYDGLSWSPLTIKGVNIGTALPGKWYTEFPADRDLYRRWLEDIAAMNANSIRLYTLLDPTFYQVLFDYNSDPDNPPLWLFQEIWPHDEIPGHNLHDVQYSETYKEEIRLVIDALHGNADIPARPYRAYGNYSADVSPYLIGLMIGRELEPEAVAATNMLNPEITGFEGLYVKTTGQSTATEAWLAEMCNYSASYSIEQYGRQYPVGFVSWPTLDPLSHTTELNPDGNPDYNDREVVDPAIFSPGSANLAGFYGSYHIYPNYPDFMNNEPSFADYEDHEGVFRYKGYLNQFMAIHPPYPALVAEFGISTSLNTAHLSPDGLHHGGLSEEDQGRMIVRMMKAILDEGYAGGLIFEWSDEWAKKTWSTEPFMVPWERQVLWHNKMCPEQNYGLLAVEPPRDSRNRLQELWSQPDAGSSFNPPDGELGEFGKIKALKAASDEAFLYLAITISETTKGPDGSIPWDQFGLAIAIDTGFPETGEFRLPFAGLPELPSGAEFMLDLQSPGDGSLLVIPSYNRGQLKFNPQTSHNSQFERIKFLVNRERQSASGLKFPALYADESTLRYGNFNPEAEDYYSSAHWYSDRGETVLIRLPWPLLNVADPSSGALISDHRIFTNLPARDELRTAVGRGFSFFVVTYDRDKQMIDFAPRKADRFDPTVTPFNWERWEIPSYQFRLKKSYPTIADYFNTL